MQNDVNMFSKESICRSISIYLAHFFKFYKSMLCFIFRPGMANFFWKGPDNKYFQFCRPCGLLPNLAMDNNILTNIYGNNIPIKLYLQN